MNIILFGTGRVAKKILAHPLREGNRIVGIYDNDSNKWGKAFVFDNKANISNIRECIVQAPEKIKDVCYDFAIIVVLNGEWEIKKQLLDLGVDESKIILSFGYGEAEYLDNPLDRFFIIEKKSKIPFTKKPAEIYRHYEGETSKAHARRVRDGFFEKYCNGDGLDVGYGGDVITLKAAGWDLRNGDAQYLDGISDESFDFVYSSHCIEHMRNVRVALQNWFRVVKPGGYLLLYLPHRDLYEKRNTLPSQFNLDHKHMFLIGRSELPDTLDIVEEISRSLSDYDIKYVKTCDEGHVTNPPGVQDSGEYSIEVVVKKL